MIDSEGILKSFVSELICVDGGVRPLKLIVTSPGLFPTGSGRFVLESEPFSWSWKLSRIKLKFHVAPTLTRNMVFRAACVTDDGGYLDDVLIGSGSGDFWLANDLWQSPDQFDYDAAWEAELTEEVVRFNGKTRDVFTIRNVMHKNRAVIEKTGHYTYVRMSEDKPPARFILGDISDIEYH
ncbi:hypothetical protein [Pseudomonas entomophila]|nr:hypothetical protein [Pseudomonas entomophila]WMW05236.1 hypothetical protein RAH46_23395 [Pseudomonas entomophila]